MSTISSVCSEWYRPISPSTSSGATATSKGGGTSGTFQPPIFLAIGSGRTATRATRTLYKPSLWLMLLNRPGLFGHPFLSAPCLTLLVDPARKKGKLGGTSSPARKFRTRNRRRVRLRIRQQHARNALDIRVPGRKGATVFQWEVVGDFQLCINIGHSTASQIWASYPGGQKRYDSFMDE